MYGNTEGKGFGDGRLGYGEQLAGVFWGSICFGIPGRWWRDEHYEHHSFTHTTLKDQGVSDPQFDEDIWVTGKRIYPFRTSPVQVRFWCGGVVVHLSAKCFIGAFVECNNLWQKG